MKNIQIYTFKRNVQSVKYILLLTMLFMACEDFVEIAPPKESLVKSEVFANDITALSAMTGVYTYMMNRTFSSGYYNRSITFLSGLSADEYTNYNSSLEPFFYNALLSTDSNLDRLWSGPYSVIYRANSILEGIMSAESGVSADIEKQLEGEAKFVRAFSYFYLVNLFGDVPLYTSSDFWTNSRAERSPVSQVYQQIITDLEDARELLLNDYSAADGERTRPNSYAAMALLARVYLYLKDWEKAETIATNVITHTALYGLEEDLNQVFLANSQEAIWQLVPVEPGYNTNEGRHFILNSPPINSTSKLELSDAVLKSFEFGDLRREDWVGSYTVGSETWFYPYKYKIATGANLTEYSMVLRFAEQYLIRAEARAMQNNLTGENSAASDINAVRHRANLGDTSAVTQDELLDAIIQERRVEFFAEWGHRWLDLKRTGTIDEVLGMAKSNWEPTDALYPIPEQELLNNPNIVPNP